MTRKKKQGGRSIKEMEADERKIRQDEQNNEEETAKGVGMPSNESKMGTSGGKTP